MRGQGRGALTGVPLRKKRIRGASVLEATLLCPWIFFVFIGAFDTGTYLNALISTEDAVRTAGLYYASSPKSSADAARSCYYALEILRAQANVHARVSACLPAAASVNQAKPVALVATTTAGPDGKPATTVTLTYQTIPLIPIPLLLPGQINITRSVQFKQ